MSSPTGVGPVSVSLRVRAPHNATPERLKWQYTKTSISPCEYILKKELTGEKAALIMVNGGVWLLKTLARLPVKEG